MSTLLKSRVPSILDKQAAHSAMQVAGHKRDGANNTARTYGQNTARPDTATYFDSYPSKPGTYSWVREGNVAAIDSALKQFLEHMSTTRNNFKVISCNMTPFFNGVHCLVVYSFD